MRRSLNIVVSSGGTAVPIDDVRILTNRSKGTTGSLISEAALSRGHNVDYVYAENARQPFGRELTVDPHADLEAELARVRAVVEKIKALPGSLNEHLVRDFFAYQERLLALVAEPRADVAILAMAASDYGPKKVEGKIASSGDGLDLKLEALPKIISQVKQTREGIFLVGFKLLTQDSGEGLLLEKAFRSMRRDGQDLAVANLVDKNFRPKRTMILTPDEDLYLVKRREDLADMLLDEIEARF